MLSTPRLAPFVRSAFPLEGALSAAHGSPHGRPKAARALSYLPPPHGRGLVRALAEVRGDVHPGLAVLGVQPAQSAQRRRVDLSRRPVGIADALIRHGLGFDRAAQDRHIRGHGRRIGIVGMTFQHLVQGPDRLGTLARLFEGDGERVQLPDAAALAEKGKLEQPINARAETAATTPMFRDALARRRCLVPIDTFYEWQAVVAPAGTPAAIIAKLNREIARTLDIPEVKKRIAGVGAQTVGGTPEELAAFIKKEIAMWAKVVKAAGIRAD